MKNICVCCNQKLARNESLIPSALRASTCLFKKTTNSNLKNLDPTALNPRSLKSTSLRNPHVLVHLLVTNTELCSRAWTNVCCFGSYIFMNMSRGKVWVNIKTASMQGPASHDGLQVDRCACAATQGNPVLGCYGCYGYHQRLVFCRTSPSFGWYTVVHKFRNKK